MTSLRIGICAFLFAGTNLSKGQSQTLRPAGVNQHLCNSGGRRCRFSVTAFQSVPDRPWLQGDRIIDVLRRERACSRFVWKLGRHLTPQYQKQSVPMIIEFGLGRGAQQHQEKTQAQFATRGLQPPSPVSHKLNQCISPRNNRATQPNEGAMDRHAHDSQYGVREHMSRCSAQHED